ncbi:DUF4397 domain-containing protein [Lewinella sp. IMCC34183]|uniref:DUF4397 domain-containing protein n=1 Tax=Lewinella sp. IMCC34183 TaxID=2248762 RepID=UPI001300775B|nr:DUF4397 domain-containing protein [Lewinella sp. IMCC34183]
MTTSNPYLLLLMVLLLAACGGDTPAPVQLRVGEFLYTSDSARVVLTDTEGKDVDFSLAYAELSDYRSLPPGTYSVRVSIGARELLEQKIGLGAEGRYTMVLAGIPKKDQEVNQAAFGTKLHRIFEGAAARTANQFLPQLFLQNDYYVKLSGKGNLRVTHLAPGLLPLDVHLLHGGQEETSFSGIAYAHASDRERLATGQYEAAVHPAGSPLERLRFPVELDTAAFHNYYLIPDTAAGQRLRVVAGRTTQ